MPARRISVRPSAAALTPTFDAIRTELGIPDTFPAEVDSAAAAACAHGPVLPPDVRGGAGVVRNALDLPLITIDPAGSRDLDQAYTAARRSGGGYRVQYAIADVNAFVTPGDAVDVESHRRGVTLYQPDRRTPLYPEVIGQGAASLLPGEERQSLLWTIDLDGDGMPAGAPELERSRVRSRRALSYPAAQGLIDGSTLDKDDPLMLLREIGTLREQREIDRGGVSLQLPAQDVVISDGGVDLMFDVPLAVEGWNAQISLLAGIVAAGIMLEGRIGILRTLPPPDTDALDALRRKAAALETPWPDGVTYPQFVHGLDPSTARGAALLNTAARALRGAGYTAFDGSVPADPGHSAVASTYAHVTAPLRRLADRYANEVVLALCAGVEAPAWVTEALPQLPSDMAVASRRERDLERAIVDGVEAFLLTPHVGEVFDAVVISDDRRGRRMVQLRDPAVVGQLVEGEQQGSEAAAGDTIRVRLRDADPVARTIHFVPA